MSINLTGKIISIKYNYYKIQLSKKSLKSLTKLTPCDFKTPLDKNELTIKTSKYTKLNDAIAGDKIDLVCRYSYYRYAADADFNNISAQGISLSPVSINKRGSS